MDIELPSSGCNILNGSTSFYNYSPDRKTRRTFYIYDGKSFMTSETYSQTGYTYSGTCLSTGDLIYKPELKVYFPLLCFSVICFALVLLYNIIFKRFIK